MGTDDSSVLTRDDGDNNGSQESEMENPKERETAALLAGILEELKVIREHIGQLPPPQIQPQPVYAARHGFHEDPDSSRSAEGLFTKEERCGPILREALRRYRTDAVPQWSTFYGAHLSTPPTYPEYSLKESERRLAWSSLVGECWQIPHDNRVSLCFLGTDTRTDPVLISRVRNFLHYFHDSHANESPRGRYFNVWDWFDSSGVSTYWYPYKSPFDLDMDTQKRRQVETGLPDEKELVAALPAMVAPWRRMINFQGLTTVRNCESAEKRSRVTDEELCPFLLPKTEEAIFELPVNDMVWRAVRSHLRSQRATELNHSELLAKGCLLFHVTFYEILGLDYAPGLTELWPCGELYSDGQNPKRRIRESALTIIAVPGGEVTDPTAARTIFWTMICLRPLHFEHPYYFERRDDLSQGDFHEMIDDMSDVAHKCLLAVLDRWDAIAAYFDEILCEKKALFDPAYHDTLLTDDVALSRSKKYFWAIEFLKELEKSVLDNITQVQRLLSLLRAHPPPAGRHPRDFDARLRKQHAGLAKLETLRARFAQKREEAAALRDGLFSASAVIESRTSTKLGENIKLLTFVSIFFLPLSFCTSLWSISDDIFPLSGFVMTMPILSVCTYIVTLNLDLIASFWHKLRRRGKGRGKGIPNRSKHEEELPDSPRPLPGGFGEVHVHVEVDVESCANT